MFDNDFDPYDALIQLQFKLQEVERAHNLLAKDYIRTQKDLDLALSSIQSLQKGHLALSKIVTNNPLFQIGQK